MHESLPSQDGEKSSVPSPWIPPCPHLLEVTNGRVTSKICLDPVLPLGGEALRSTSDTLWTLG